MKTLPPKALAEAFALSGARGADLLARLGAFRVWDGDLATMRGDDPYVEAPGGDAGSDDPQQEQDGIAELVDTVRLARAIELLNPIHRTALAGVYLEHKDAAALAADLDTDSASAASFVVRCEQRLAEIYDSLSGTPGAEVTVPQWVSDRDHAGGSPRR
jgi:DNA-directed RNA polymerase specialized sigma24 family protein